MARRPPNSQLLGISTPSSFAPKQFLSTITTGGQYVAARTTFFHAPRPMPELQQAIQQAASQYFRLVILAAPPRSGKTAVLREFSALQAFPFLNVNLELSRRLLEYSRAQRTRYVASLLREVIAAVPGPVVILDNIEILFDTSLEVEPLRLLQTCSRQRTLVVAWNGTLTQGCLCYAEPGHPEYLCLSQLKPSDALLLTISPAGSPPSKVTAP